MSGISLGANKPNWRDESPERYGIVLAGDFCVIEFPDKSHHFIKIDYEELRPASNRAVCDAEVEWSFHTPLGGIVDCGPCLFEYWECNPPND